jgi:hypothetical protein
MSWDDERWARRHHIVETIRMNRLYHQSHERFLAMCDRGAKALALIVGTAAASQLLEETGKAVAGAVVACVTLPSLVFAWADRARLHAELASEYARLESEIEAAGVLEWGQLDSFGAKMLAINAKEPPALASLIVSCQNELYVAAGQPEKVKPLGWWRRLWLHVFSMPKNDTQPKTTEPDDKGAAGSA